MFKKDNIYTGLLLGLFFPALAYLIVEVIKKNIVFLQKDDLLYIGCVAINLLMLRYAFKKDKEQIGRGLIAATFICAIIFCIYKLKVS